MHRAGMAFGGGQAAVFKNRSSRAGDHAPGCCFGCPGFSDVVFLLFNEFSLGFIFCKAACVAFFPLMKVGGVIAAVDSPARGSFPR
jgi:hypothetical protein